MVLVPWVMTMPSALSSSKILWMVRTRSSQSLSTSAWLGRRRNGSSWTSAMLFQLGQLLEQLAVVQTLARFDVPGEIETVLADRVDGAAG